jgi:competence protein ComEC
VPVRIGRAGDHETIDGAVIDTLAPADPLLLADPAAANNSLVVRVSWGETAFLFAGGIERAGEDALIARAGPQLRADWLRVSRFGTREASSPEFLRLVSPEFAVISVGTPNSGDYPHVETLGRLQNTGARLYRTDQGAGDLTFTSDGATVSGP